MAVGHDRDEPPGPVGKFVHRHADGFKKAELAVIGGLVVVLALMLGYGFFRVITGDVTHCSEKTSATFWPTGVGLAGAALLGFTGGRLVGYLRKSRYGGPQTLARRAQGADPVVGLMLAIFLVAATLLLGYETFALGHGGDPPPITSYVRCAAADQPWISAIAAAIISLFLGNWIWYPTKKRPWRPDRD